MGKVILEIDTQGNPITEYKTFDKEEIYIGRGFDNDVIINDQYIDAKHLKLTVRLDHFECEDLGTLNGTQIIKDAQAHNKTVVKNIESFQSGAQITIGRSTIMVYHESHPVVATRSLMENNFKGYIHIQKSFVIALVSFFTFFYILFTKYDPRVDTSLSQILVLEIALFVILCLWAGFWSLITRYSKKSFFFVHHLTNTLQSLIIVLLGNYLMQYLTFYIQNEQINTFLSLIFLTFIGSYVLNLHLAIATNMPFKKRALTISVLMGPMLFFIFLSMLTVNKTFDPKPKHIFNILPIPEKMIPANSIEEHLKQIKTLFKETI